MSNREEQIKQFLRLIRARTTENKAALLVLMNANFYGVAFGLLRQEIDSLIKVAYLADNSDARVRKHIRSLVSGERWRHETERGKLVYVTDREMLDKSKSLIGWEKTVYEFGCKLIHLSEFHDYDNIDPISTFFDDQVEEIIGYLKQYHEFEGESLDLNVLIEYLPNVMDKVCANTLGYVSILENRFLSK
ncbi:MAG TPA: hypothetical protein ENJ46_01970 [Hellea balneolensis]|uniref:AbiV family abortive infection protein n=1 Tax=Hellea balneolensis TaxID=287478 RepID=A0A7C3CBQ0_9PROT|nr:hypothetical protein [Hellea balneolensis]